MKNKLSSSWVKPAPVCEVSWDSDLDRRQVLEAELSSARFQKGEGGVQNQDHLYQIALMLPGILWLEHPDSQCLQYLSCGFAEELGFFGDQLPLTLSAWLPLVHPEDRNEAAMNGSTTRLPIKFTFRLQDNEGRWRWISCRRHVIKDLTNGLRRVAGYAEDLTLTISLEETVKELSEALQSARSQERRRIARELHDGTGQEIADVALTLSRLEVQMPGMNGHLQQILAESRRKLEQCSRSIRVYTYLQHPPLLEEFGLTRALRHFIIGFSERTGIEVTFETSPSLPKLPVEVECAFFRITQESLNNIYKHSGSSGASVQLAGTWDLATLHVRDRGRGLPAGLLEEATEEGCFGVGILGMRERMHLLGGQLKIESSTSGTSIIALFRTGNLAPSIN